MPSTTSSDELVGFVRKRIAVVNPSPHFQGTSATYQFTDERGYLRVNVRVAFDDTAAITPSGSESLKLLVIALYCRHTVRQQLGFFAAYSHRGKTDDDQIESAARGFIAGIEVPKE